MKTKTEGRWPKASWTECAGQHVDCWACNQIIDMREAAKRREDRLAEKED